MSTAILVSLAGGAPNRPPGKGLVQRARDGLVEPPSLLPVAVPGYLRFAMVRAIRLFVAMTPFPAYQRVVSLPVPAMVVIGSEDPVRPSWQVISRALADVPEQVTIVLFPGASHAINCTHPHELSHAIRQYVAGQEVRMDRANPTGVPALQLQRPL